MAWVVCAALLIAAIVTKENVFYIASGFFAIAGGLENIGLAIKNSKKQ